MKLLIQPEQGVGSLIKAIDLARKRIEIAIFRLDHAEIKRALERAVDRGVSVHILTADTNHGGEKNLRGLEMDMLSAGAEVSRTADDLRRHHYKFMIIDREVLYVFTFNYTHLDIEHSRSFGVMIDDPKAVEEAARLFDADARRRPYKPEIKSFIVSPINAREALSNLIQRAKKQLLIYDPEISDRAMIRLLRERARQGVEIRIIGVVTKPSHEFDRGRLMRMRFHTRTILRDHREAFLGSQGLRESELNTRRELGIITDDHDVVHSLVKVFERDWAELPTKNLDSHKGLAKDATALKKSVKAIVKELPLSPILQAALQDAVQELPKLDLQRDELRRNLTDAIKDAVEGAVSRSVRNKQAVSA